MSTTLHRLEGPRPTIGGFLITFPSGTRKTVHWEYDRPIKDTLTAAKGYAAKVVQTLLDEGKHDDIGRTNWTSVTAAIQAIIVQWNTVTRAAFVSAIGLPDAPIERPDVGKIVTNQ
jgi:hypothetical protein